MRHDDNDFRYDFGAVKVWRQNGLWHRDGAPAAEYPDDSKLWYQDGKLHRLDGPAQEWANGSRRWFIEGKEIFCKSQDEFERLIKLKAFW